MKRSFIEKVLKYNIGQHGSEISGVSIDSRNLKKGELFVAVPGKQIDGHMFVKEALDKGAAAVLVSQDVGLKSNRLIRVADTTKALGQIASAWRDEFDPLLIGITGSNGKTTVKELTLQVLTDCFGKDQVLGTIGNLNNHLGVPLTLLRLCPTHRYAVVEMGMNHPYEIAYLSHLAKPDIALVNNVFETHIGCQGFTYLEDIACAKAEIFSGLSTNGLAVVSEQAKSFKAINEAIQAFHHLSFGLAQDNDICVSKIYLNTRETTYQVYDKKQTAQVHINLLGQHNVFNSMAVFAILQGVPGLNWQMIAESLAHYRSGIGRQAINYLHNGVTLIDDSYNANPMAMRCAVNVLANYPQSRILVMGDMGELGEQSQSLHQEIGHYAKIHGVTYLLALGSESQAAVASFGDRAFHYISHQDLIKDLNTLLKEQKNAVVLVKGSRFMHMEKVCQALLCKEE